MENERKGVILGLVFVLIICVCGYLFSRNSASTPPSTVIESTEEPTPTYYLYGKKQIIVKQYNFMITKNMPELN